MAAIIQFSDGTYHGGGTAYLNSVENVNSAKTYISVNKARSVLRILKGKRRRYEEMIDGAIVWEVDYNFLKGHKYEIL
ncbi:hypothetical protein EC55P2_00019 [Enterococcus phage EC55P2]|nr:hypothetical protein EC55P2_00019 [Enterococcus phage EC55P2]